MPDVPASLLLDPRFRLSRNTDTPSLTPFGLKFTAEGGTNGNSVATSDTGNGDAPDAVSIGTGATFAYDNSTAAVGSQSIQAATSATAAVAFLRWSSTVAPRFLPTSHLWASTYFKFSAVPATSLPIMFARTRLDAGAIAVRFHTDGTLRIYDSANGFVRGMASSVPLNSWFRVDAFFQASPTMAIAEVKMFNTPWSLVPDDIVYAGGIAGDDIVFTGFRAGICGGNIASIGPFWMDQPTVNNVAYPTPDFSVSTITLTDTGTGSDSIVDSAVVMLPDSGAGDDSGLVMAATVGLSDSGSSSETFGDSTTATLADSGIGAESIIAAIVATLADSGAGSDVVSATQPKDISDSGFGVDSLVVSVIATLGDLGEGVDSVVQYFFLPDSGSGGDSVVAAVTVTLVDSGSGTDSLQASQVFIVNLSDTGTGTDSLVAISDNTNTVTLSDSGSGADTIVTSPVLSLTDTGHGVDAIVITVQMWLGFDDPVREGHEPFDPDAPAEDEFIVASPAPFVAPEPYAERTGMIMVPYVWDMDEKLFVAHMHHMHGGKNPVYHYADHSDGEGGVVRHIHG